MFTSVKATPAEISQALPGDAIVLNPEVVMDRAFTLNATPDNVWPWFMQLGKNRAGWYFPRSVEHFIVPGKRGLWRIEPSLQNLSVGSVIDDWGGKNASFEVAELQPPHALVHQSVRGQTKLSWAIILTPAGSNSTRVQLRLRLGHVKFSGLARSLGGLVDLLTVAGLAKGLQQRLQATSGSQQ